MIPSLVAGEVRTGIVEYLTTTFALADDETRDALSAFLQDPDDGIFRGPYLRIRPPFRQVDDGWRSPLDYFPLEWAADGIRPHRHQGLAWERLAGRERTPEPTVLTTGTGSGKTEGFEIPILDHVIWARQQQVPGIKALVLYPMNALASDQAGRFAERIAADELLAGIRVGLFVGLEPDAETVKQMSAVSVITDQGTQLDDPPDVLLTNYKMLDRLLTTPDRTRIWAANTPASLRYVVLDEFHTYDGAQGTDVAMLLRRLGARLQVGDTDPATGRLRPLGACAPVGTSATLGTADAAGADLRRFTGKVFGRDFPDESIITESRRSVEESTPEPSVFEMPDPLILAKLHDVEDDESLREVAGLFLGEPCPSTADGDIDLFALGERIAAHHLMRPLLSICGAQPVRWSTVAAKVAERDAGWAKAHRTEPGTVEAALAWFVALVSKARSHRTDKNGKPKTRTDGSDVEAELFQVEVQLWIREVSRLLRRVDPAPAFRWFDSGAVPAVGEAWLPSVFCRHCGRSGWAARASDKPRLPGCVGDRLTQSAPLAYQASVERSNLFRAMIRASPLEDDVAWLDPDSGQLFPSDNDGDGPARSTVLVMGEAAGAKSQRCPSCHNDDAIRFLGSAVTSLASVTVSQLFGSHMVRDDERKLIAFVDSVQDAAHRAGFFTGRAHRFNLRSLVAGAAARTGAPLSVDEVTDSVLADAPDPATRFQILPPDMHNDVTAKSLLTDTPTPDALDMLRCRVRLEVDLEFGLRNRIGRTIELTGAAVAYVDADTTALDQMAGGLRELHLHQVGEQQQLPSGAAGEGDGSPAAASDPAAWTLWLAGLLDRARGSGGIDHPWFRAYWHEQNPWTIWGGRPPGMPAFARGFSRPKPPSLSGGGSQRVYDRIGTGSWWENWTARVLGVGGGHAVRLVKYAFEELTDHRIVLTVDDQAGSPYWLLPPGQIVLSDVDGPTSAHRELVCDVCYHRHPTPEHLVDVYDRAPCLRWRCPGHFDARPFDVANFYRGFYRSGRMRRVVATPHTGMLTHDERTKIEAEFKGTVQPRPPDAPNVLTATPTLEMGIDIGDLSAVMLTSIPRKQAAHAQRIGHAGRKSGNSLVTTFAETDPMSLYYLTEPELMLSGDIRPPDCYLDAHEILARHLLGYAIDRSADGTFNAGAAPGRAKQLFDGFGQGGWLDLVLTQVETDPTLVAGFLELYSDELDQGVQGWVRDYAATGLRQRLGDAVARWRDEYAEHGKRSRRIGDAIKVLADKQTRSADEDKQLARLRGEQTAIRGLMKSIREASRLNTLEDLGLLPNYTLTEDTVSFHASLSWRDEDDQYQVKEMTLDRAASQAVTEFAPGAAFYGGAYKLRVDTLDIGTRSEPLYERYRLCPESAYGEPFREGEPVPHCPRCGTSKIADDVANVHRLLRLRAVSCTQSEVDARIYDDTDSREQVPFDTVTTVDIDPERIIGATWKRDRVAFAFEYTNLARIRTVNAGREHRSGTKTNIAGTSINAAWFNVCRSCGIVAGVRPKDRATGMEAHHGYCSARKGDTDEVFDPIGLYHQTDTEAVRILLPVHDMESDERIASFKAALLLGLRLSFGGDPDHLRVIDTTHPTGDPDQRQRLLIVHDTVTGGTGYVKRLADPEQMRTILTDVRAAISTCPCRTEERPACHRCLLGATQRRDVPLISRTAALEVLGPILDEWSGQPTTSDVTGIDVSGVRQSELEQRFKRLLHKLEGRTLAGDTTCQVDATPAGQNRTTFDIRFVRGKDVVTRWKVTEQVLMSTSPHTVADFVATRLDQTGFPDVTIYLDGFQFHAIATHNRLDSDTQRRDALRAAGKIVWTASWTDILDIEKAWGDNPHEPGRSRAWPAGVISKAEGLQAGVKHRVAANPFLSLIDFLIDPDLPTWRTTARSAFLGWYQAANSQSAGSTNATSVAEPRQAIDQWVGGHAIELDGTAPHVVIESRSDANLPIVFSCEKPPDGPVHAAVRLPASPQDLADEEQHRRRWTAWLHLGNTLQFLDNEGSTHTIATTSSAPSTPTTVAVSAAESPDNDDTIAAVSKSIAAPDVLEVVVAAIRAGAPGPTAGWEPDPNPDGHLVEAAWPHHRIGVLDPDPDFPQPGITAWADAHGWDVRHPGAWTARELAERTKDTP